MTQGKPEHPLRKWRKSKKLTLVEAAAGVGTVRQMWYGWEIGRRRPGALYMPRIREFTEGAITADDFFPTLEEPSTREAA